MISSHLPEGSRRAAKGLDAAIVSIVANALLAIAKIMAGVIGHSYALIADGIESTTDIFGSTIVWGGLRIGAIPPDANHPYGHGKAESLAALMVSLTLVGAAITIAIQSMLEIRTPHHLPAPFTLIVLIAVVAIKEVLFRFLSGVGKALDSLAINVDAWHHRTDALTSAAAFIGITIALLAGEGYESADDWAALFACGVVAFNGIRLMKSAIAEIMDAAPAPEIEDNVRKIAAAVNGAVEIEKCRVRKSGLGIFVEIHVEVDREISVVHGHEIAHAVKDALITSSLAVVDAVVHIEPAKGS
ncbi:MAG: cation diffusion facilitator family transporter [bacterium]